MVISITKSEWAVNGMVSLQSNLYNRRYTHTIETGRGHFLLEAGAYRRR